MSRTALVLGANGRFGRTAANALGSAGWRVRRFDRSSGDLAAAARDADVIVNGWNLPYARWATEVPRLTAAVIEAARGAGAAVLLPGNLYVYGEDLPPVLSARTPHRAAHPLGRIRRELEAAYRGSGVKTVVLRAGDFLDTEASGNWFDRILCARIAKGKFTYPGPMDVEHAWAFLPDLGAALVRLLDRVEALPDFSDMPFDGHTLTGQDLARALERATAHPIRARTMSWLPIHLARPFWSEAKHLVEMHYLWNRPHRVDGAALEAVIGPLQRTDLDTALRRACAPLLQKVRSTQTNR
ncbi:epimerase [Rhodobacterales bacterium HKCCSP123]|nr:epimerase [Rhodobacterales bacterium HKCCSP123]